VHHAEGILPQSLARALGEENVNAWLTLAVRGGDYRWRGRRSGAHGTAVGNFLRLVNAAIVENILEGVMMMIIIVVVVGAIDRVGGLVVVAGAAVIVPIKVIRKTAAKNGKRNKDLDDVLFT